MSFKIQAAALIGALTSTVSAHGFVSGAVVDGTYFQGYNPSFQFQNPPPDVIGWTCEQCLDNGFVDPSMYTDVTKIACHKDATAGKAVAPVKAGGEIELQWNTWPDSHKGPILNYMAKVDDATAATSADLNFFKISEEGFENGEWAAVAIIKNNFTSKVTIPDGLAPGQYVLRHEIIALHSEAQNYPQCINIEVTGGGSTAPEGITADKFYTPTDPGLTFDGNNGDGTTYEFPGPALFDGSGSGSGNATAPAERRHARDFV